MLVVGLLSYFLQKKVFSNTRKDHLKIPNFIESCEIIEPEPVPESIPEPVLETVPESPKESEPSINLEPEQVQKEIENIFSNNIIKETHKRKRNHDTKFKRQFRKAVLNSKL